MKKKDISEDEIDRMVVAEANDENAWTDMEYVKQRAERGSRKEFFEGFE